MSAPPLRGTQYLEPTVYNPVIATHRSQKSSMRRNANLSWSRELAVLVLSYLACDLLWLVGDNAPGLDQTERTIIRAVAWLTALVLLVARSIVMARRLPLTTIVLTSFLAVVAAAIPIAMMGLFFFPSQFPLDSDISQVLLWLSLQFAVLALLASVLSLAAVKVTRIAHTRFRRS